MLRKSLLGLGALAALLALGAAALLLLVGANALRPQIEQTASIRCNRALRIEGVLRLSALPRIAIELPKTTLSERETAATFARFEGARVGVAPWPLLAGRFEADRISIDGLAATIGQHRDGSTNVDGLLGRGFASSTPTGNRSGGREQADFAFGGIELSDAQLTLIDDGQIVLTVSKIGLAIAAVAARASAPVAMTAAFSVAKARALMSMSLTGTSQSDLATKTPAVESQQTRLNVAVDRVRRELQMRVARLSIGETVERNGIDFELWPAGKREPHIQGGFDGIGGNWPQMSAKAPSVDVNIQQGKRNIWAQPASPVQVSIEATSLQLRERSGDVTLNDPTRAAKLLKLPIKGLDRDRRLREAREPSSGEGDETHRADAAHKPEYFRVFGQLHDRGRRGA